MNRDKFFSQVEMNGDPGYTEDLVKRHHREAICSTTIIFKAAPEVRLRQIGDSCLSGVPVSAIILSLNTGAGQELAIATIKTDRIGKLLDESKDTIFCFTVKTDELAHMLLWKFIISRQHGRSGDLQYCASMEIGEVAKSLTEVFGPKEGIEPDRERLVRGNVIPLPPELTDESFFTQFDLERDIVIRHEQLVEGLKFRKAILEFSRPLKIHDVLGNHFAPARLISGDKKTGADILVQLRVPADKPCVEIHDADGGGYIHVISIKQFIALQGE